MSNTDRVNKAFLNRVRALTLAIGEADLTAGATSQVLDMASLPPGAMVLAVDIRVATAFTGGGTTDAKVAVGDANDDDGILASADVDVATDGGASTFTIGISPYKFYAAATVLKVKVTSTGANVSAFTAGAMTVRVMYAIPGA